MASYIGMYKRSQKRIKMRMETIVNLYGKGNEIISWYSLCIRSYLVLSGNFRYMCCHCQNMLHQIYMNRIGNDNFAKVQKLSLMMTISICVVKKKVRNLFVRELHSPMR